MDHHEQTITQYQKEQKEKHEYQIVCHRIDDMLNLIQEVTFDAGGLLDGKQYILNMSVSKLLEMFARNSIFMDLKYRKPFEFKVNEARNDMDEKKL